VPDSNTLTIEPGTTLFFNSGTGITINTGGRLVAEGSQYQRIRLTRVPGTSNIWDGLNFNHTLEDNRLAYADQEFGAGQGEAINILYSRVTIDNMSWAGTNNNAVAYMVHPQVTISNSYLPGISNEPIHGVEMTGDEYLILKGNVFAANGGNDVVDWDGTDDGNISFFAFNNIFLGGGDDGLDLDATDAYIEGNIFMNFHCSDPATTTSNAIGGGKSYGSNTNLPDYTIVRNIFVSNDHSILIKEGAYATVINNAFVDSNDAAIQFCENGRAVTSPGSGAYLDGNIFWKYLRPLKYLIRESDLDPETGWPADPNVTVNNSIITDENYPGSDNLSGSGNIDADPVFVDEQGDFHLKGMSPAIGTGPWGLDIGAYVPAGAAVCGEPDVITYRTDATLTAGGPGITHYKYQLKDNGSLGSWSGELAVDTPIELTGLLDGHSYTVYVTGKNAADIWQSDPCYVASRTWTIDTSYSRLVINELLGHTHGAEPDVIELYYDGPTGSGIDLTDMSLTDDPCLPRKFVFNSQTVTTAAMNPGDYMVLYGDLQTQLKNHLGFALSADGDGLYLYDKPANGGGLIDSVVFGPQINDYSIGRVGYGSVWKLTKPTFGSANIAQPLGDPYRLKINEWLANEEVLFDEDFVELYNPCNLPVDLSELYLTDNPVTQPTKQKLGPLSFAPPNGFAVFIADDVNAPGQLDFKLSADRGMIGLFDAERNEIDKVIYGPQTTDISQGRSPNGSDHFEFFALPTPYVTNPSDTITTTTTLIAIDDTWSYEQSNTDLGTTWRAVDYNDSLWPAGAALLYVESAALPAPKNTLLTIGPRTFYFRKHFTLDVDPNNVTEFKLSTVIDDGAVFYINGDEAFRLGIDEDTVVQHSTFADRTIDNATYEGPFIIPSSYFHQGNNVIAVEVHQCSTSSSDIVFGLKLDAVVETIDQSLERPLTLVDGLRVTEIMYHDPIGSDFDFIELQNIGDEPLDINGVRFIDGIEFTFPAMPPLGSGEHVVVVGDLPSFVSRYGGGINVAGEYTGNLSNGGENIVLQLPWPYEATIMRFEYKDSWYPSTDGLGDLLTIREPYAHPATWNKAESWQASPPSP
jgi:hypothetical protein